MPHFRLLASFPTGAIVDCGDREGSVCAGTVVDVVGEFADLPKAVAAATIHCQNIYTLAGKKQCTGDAEASVSALKPVVSAIQQAVSDCAWAS